MPFSSLQDLPLKQKLMRIVMLVSSISLIFAAGVFMSRGVFRVLNSTYHHVEVLADVIGFNSQAALTFDDRNSAQETLSALKSEPQIAEAAVYNKSDAVFASYHRDLEKFAVPPITLGARHFFKDGYLWWFRPIQFGGDKLGTVLIVVDISDLVGGIGWDLLLALLILFLSLAAAYWLSARLQQVISTPILHLLSVIKRVSAEQNYELRVTRHGSDELGMLIDGFNHMLELVQQRDQQLAKHSAVLEETVAKRTAELRAIVDTAPDAIIICRRNGEIVSLNHAAEKIFQVNPATCFGQSITLFISRGSSPGSGDDIAGLLQAVKESEHAEFNGLRGDGTRFPMEIALSETVMGHETILTVIGRDISLRKQMETQLFQSQKLESIGQLAAGIAHEINTPIQFVGDNVTFIQSEFPRLVELLTRYGQLTESLKSGTPNLALAEQIDALIGEIELDYLLEEIPRAVQQSLDGIQRVSHIVRSMKEFSHPAGKEKTLVDINRLIDSTATVSKNEWKYLADMDMQLDKALPMVPCFPNDLSQVILNLIINAAHAIGDVSETKKGKITVSTRIAENKVEIRIGDTGKGIPDAIRSRIFDPFFTTKEVGKGTGQGLAIAHSIVVGKHGGEISFESEIGKGTTFIILLPLGG